MLQLPGIWTHCDTCKKESRCESCAGQHEDQCKTDLCCVNSSSIKCPVYIKIREGACEPKISDRDTYFIKKIKVIVTLLKINSDSDTFHFVN